jgi:hypothetical protein
MFHKILKSLTDQKGSDRQAEQYRELIRAEAKIGGKLFGPIPKGHRREFFCLDEHTWIWYEEWEDANKQRRSKTTRYDVRPNGVIKIQDGHPSQYVELDEARNLYQAVDLYNQRIDAAYDLP